MGYILKDDDYARFLTDYYPEQTIVKRFKDPRRNNMTFWSCYFFIA